MIKINLELSSRNCFAKDAFKFLARENLARASVIETLHLEKDQLVCALGCFLRGYFLKVLRAGNNLSNACDCFLRVVQCAWPQGADLRCDLWKVSTPNYPSEIKA